MYRPDRGCGRPGLLAALAGASLLSACATRSPSSAVTIARPTVQAPPPAAVAAANPAEPAPPAAAGPPIPNAHDFEALTGWLEDDHVAAVNAIAAGCPAVKDPAMSLVCQRLLALGPVDETRARNFLESNFRPEISAGEIFDGPGLLTGYFMPVYEARRRREGDFTAPVRPRPADLPRGDRSETIRYPDRAEIEARSTRDALAWMRPEDLFFMQIQGSGVLTMPDGESLKAIFDGSNGAPFLGLAAPMRRQGLISDAASSAEGIRAWLAAHRGSEAAAIMRLDRRYVFFRLEPDDGRQPAGSAGQRLIPGRAVAVDPNEHPMGEVLWLDAAAPALTGAFPAYHRLAMALDTGGAIKGEARADLYLGRGPAAGLEAGRVRHALRLYRLAPLAQPRS